MTDANSLNLDVTGIVTMSGPTFTGRSMAVGSSKLSISNADGTAGNPTYDAVEANFTLNNIGGTLGETKGGTNQTTYTTGDILYASASNTLSKLAIGSADQVLTVSSGLPSWQDAAGGSGSLVWLDTVTASGAASIEFKNLAAYDVYFFSFEGVYPASANQAIYMQVSTDNGSSYIATSYESLITLYAYDTGAATNVSGTTVVQLSSNMDSAGGTDHGLHGYMYAYVSSAFHCYYDFVGYQTNIGNKTFGGRAFSKNTNTGVDAFKFYTSSGNINGTIKIYGLDTSGGGGSSFAWNEVTGTSQAMLVNNGYIANNGSLVTLTIPSTANLGDEIQVCGKGSGFFKIAQNSGQTIHYLDSATTTGTGGSITSTEQYVKGKLLCITADTDWVFEGSGNYTIV